MKSWGVDGSSGVVALHDAAEIATALERISRDVTDEVCSFTTLQPDPAAVAQGRILDRQLLDRGVTLRMICLAAFRRDASVARHLMESVSMGVRIRTCPVLPSRMIVFDRVVAVLPFDLGRPEAGAIIVHNPGIVHLLHTMFEMHWANAEPVEGQIPQPTVPGPQPMELAVLSLMAVGHKDDAIARSIGQSSRTVRRLVAGLAERLEARSRFDLALRASARGWVKSPFG